GVGFQRAALPGVQDKPHEIGIWYPSDAPMASEPLGAQVQTVARDGAISGSALPLVVILYGDQSSFENHYGTALALAGAGFVVVGINQDTALVERPKHVSAVVDYLLGGWNGRERIDPARIGIYGFSVGGFTALVASGGVPDFSRIAPHCAEH